MLSESRRHMRAGSGRVAPVSHTDQATVFRFAASPAELAGSNFEFRAQGYLAETRCGRVAYRQTLGGEAGWFHFVTQMCFPRLLA